MIKTFKRVLLSCLSILGISLFFWVFFLLNPSWSYANKTQIDFVTVYHNQALEAETETVVKHAINIIKKSGLVNEETAIQFCLNDDKIYPNLYPFAGGTAYAFLNKTVIYASKPNFKDNVAEYTWAVNNNELRKFKLSFLLAHEFTHNLQNQIHGNYVIKSTLGKINWKLEGHAEYISREFQNDGALKTKIEKYLLEAQKEHIGLPAFDLEDGTKQIFSYYKYALVIQYLMEEKALDFYQICALDTDLDGLYGEMIEWSEN